MKIKNLEVLDQDKIDDNLIKWLNGKFKEFYPEVKEKKEKQRKECSIK